MSLDATIEQKREVPTRYLILLIIFIVTAVNYADRATLSIAGTEVAKELQLSAVSMGYIFSAFGWAYLLMQIPGGWLLDKFGSKKVYSYSLFFWSLFTFLQGFVDMFPLAWAGISMFLCALCWVSLKRHLSRQTPVSSRRGFRRKSAGPHRRSLTPRSISPGAVLAAAGLADLRLGLGARLHRHGRDWLCADRPVGKTDP